MRKILTAAQTGMLVIAITALVFTACSKGSDEVKLLESIITHDGDITIFEYDDQNRIVLIIPNFDNAIITLTYNGNNIESITRTVNANQTDPDFRKMEFRITENDIFVKTYQTEYNLIVSDDGYLIGSTAKEYVEDVMYQYINGDLANWSSVTLTDYGSGLEEMEFGVRYIYDTMKSPLYYCNTPKWFLSWYLINNFSLGLVNNITSEQSMDSNNYTYEYDSDGFPISRLISYSDNKITYKYRTVKNVKGDSQKRLTYTPPERAPRSASASHGNDLHAKVLSGDLLDFAGTYVANNGNVIQLKLDGYYVMQQSGNIWENELVGGFKQFDDCFSWAHPAGDFGMYLVPAGVDLILNGKVFQTDNSKDRLITEDMHSAPVVYYREGELLAAGYAKILTGDFSGFAGIWVNSYTRNQLFTNGVFVNTSTRSIDGITTSDYTENNGAYIWGLYDDGRLGYEIGLFPAGVPLMLGQNLVVTDATKDRIIIYQFDGLPANDDVFYKE